MHATLVHPYVAVDAADYLINGGSWHCLIHEGVPLVLFVCLVELIKLIVGQAGTSDASVRRAMKRARARTLPADADQLSHYKDLGLVSHQAGHAALISLSDAALVARQFNLPAPLIQQMEAPTPAVPVVAQQPAVAAPPQHAAMQQPNVVAPHQPIGATQPPPPIAQQPELEQDSIPVQHDDVLAADISVAPQVTTAAATGVQQPESRMILLSQLHPSATTNITTAVPSAAPTATTSLLLHPTAAHNDGASTFSSWMQPAAGLGGLQNTPISTVSLQQGVAPITSYSQGHNHSGLAGSSAAPTVLPAAPRHLPAVTFTPDKLHLPRYRLPDNHPARPAVDGQLALMEQYFRVPIDLARPEGVNRLSEASWETVRADALR